MSISLIVGIVVLGYIIFRRVVPRPVTSGMRLPLILAAGGLVELLPYLKGNHDSGLIITELTGSLMLAVFEWHGVTVCEGVRAVGGDRWA